MKRSFGTIAGITVGKFNVPIGTGDMTTAYKVEEMLTELAQLGRHGAVLLLDIAKKRRRPIDVFHIWKNQEVRDIPALVGEDCLKEAWQTFVKTARRKDGLPLARLSVETYGYKLNQLVALKPEATVRDLPTILSLFRDVCVSQGKHAEFNNVRKACLAFARNTQPDKQYSVLWREISKVEGTPSTPKKRNTALPVYEVREIIDGLPDERMKNVAWALALTGMRIGEYVAGWGVAEDRVLIHGSKTQAAERYVPLLAHLTPEPFYYAHAEPRRNQIRPGERPLHYGVFRAALYTVSDGKLDPHNIRHSYRLWLEEAGIPDLRANMYFGHGEKGLKERYARHRIDLRLEEDTERLVAHVEREWERPKLPKIRHIRRLKLA